MTPPLSPSQLNDTFSNRASPLVFSPSENPLSYIEELPLEMSTAIFKFLSLQDLSQARLSSKKMKKIADESYLKYFQPFKRLLSSNLEATISTEKYCSNSTYCQKNGLLLIEDLTTASPWLKMPTLKKWQGSELLNLKLGASTIRNPFYALYLDPEGRELLTASANDDRITLWEMGAHQIKLSLKLSYDEEEDHQLSTAYFARSRDKIFLGFDSGLIKTWDKKGALFPFDLPYAIQGKDFCAKNKKVLSLASDEETGSVFSSHADGWVRLWNEAGHFQKKIGKIARHTSIIYDAKRKWLIGLDKNKLKIQIYDRGGSFLFSIDLKESPGAYAEYLHYDESALLIIPTATKDPLEPLHFFFYDLEQRKCVSDWKPQVNFERFAQHASFPLKGLDYDPKSQLILTVGNGLQLWHLPSQTLFLDALEQTLNTELIAWNKALCQIVVNAPKSFYTFDYSPKSLPSNYS